MEIELLEGESVILEEMAWDHLDGLWEAAREEAIWEFTATKIRSKAELEKVMADAFKEVEKGEESAFVIKMKRDGKIIGSTRFLDISRKNESLEIGWTWLHPDVWRTSINTECKYLLLKYAFEKMNINRVQLKTDKRNTRSQRAIERIGGVKEGVLRQDRKLSDGYIRDTVIYSILAAEWPEVKKALEEKLIK